MSGIDNIPDGLSNLELPLKRNYQRMFMRYVILVKEKGKWKAEFRGSMRAKPSARVGVNKERFEEFLEGIGLVKLNPLQEFKGKVKGLESVHATEDDYLFNISMIYAYLMRVLRKKERVKLYGRVTETLFRIHPFEIIFWNHHFTKSKDRYEQDRVARAFLSLYKIK